MMQTVEYGVKYTPSSVSSGNITVQDLDQNFINHIRIQWVDLLNKIRYRVVTISHFRKLLAASRPSISLAKTSLGLVFLTPAPGFTAIGEYLYAINIETLRLCSYAPGHAVVMGRFEEKVPVLGPERILTVQVPLCPRTTLDRIVNDAKTTVQFLVGFETEFILLKSADRLEPVNHDGWSISSALSSGSLESQVLDKISDALVSSGIEVQMYHAESAPGQYELVTGPLPPLEAADALIHTRETIYNIARKYGLHATLAPRLYKDNPGSAAHTHISVHSTSGINEMSTSTSFMTSLEASFLAGLLPHLPAIQAFSLPLATSYSRMLDGVWSGGTHVCWGVDNRESPVRLCNASSPSSRNFEIKCIDGTSNPYLVLAGILSAGLSGIEAKKQLTMGDVSGVKVAAEMDEASRQALGITQRMSLALEEARSSLANDTVIREYMGDQLVDSYLGVNQMLATAMEGADNETEETRVHRLVQNY